MENEIIELKSRKIIKHGNTSKIISIPKEYLTYNNIAHGNKFRVFWNKTNNSLILQKPEVEQK